MKSLFKVTLLTASMVFSLGVTSVIAAPAKPAKTVAAESGANKFKNDDERSAYALGASLGRYMENSLKEQEKLGVKLDKNLLLSGVQDAFSDKGKLNDAEIEKTLQDFEARVKAAAQAKMEKDAKENEGKGAKYAASFAKEKGVKKTASGLLYRIDKQGTGEAPKESDTVVVNYRGTLIDGTVFDNSYDRGEPLSFRLDGVIPGWTEGLKLLKKGGKMKLVIPPSLAYGKASVPGIPVNSTLVFEVELLDVQSGDEADSQLESVTGDEPANIKAE